MKVFGEGYKRILICGEAPGYNESEQNRPFIGKSGQLLKETLEKFDVDMDRDCWLYNSCICRPMTREGKNRTPTDKEISFCRPNVVKTIQELKPNVIIPLGGSAVKSILGWLWGSNVGMISRWDGWRIPCQQINAWVCPTWHPSYILRDDYGSKKQNEVRKLLFERHLEAACKKMEKPWKALPDYPSKVRRIYKDDEAADAIQEMMESGRPLAWDIENSPLKPDRADSFILCCAISDGRTSIAYPWQGRAIEATLDFIRSDVPKIGFNIKHEIRWLLRQGVRVKNWVWCGMIGAHVLDNRMGVASLEFQTFVNLGYVAGKGRMKPFFKSSGSNEHNRIREVPLDQMLMYCGTDALLEWFVGVRQAKKMGIDLFPKDLAKT
jgi:uracil-DNA glycosylase family 4